MARVLVVDDEELVRQVIVAALKREGHTVSQAANGREAAQMLAEPYDLVITDILMPERDGLETIMKLRDDRPNVPVIAITGTSGNSPLYLKLAQNLGARRTLAKPFEVPDLIRVVDEVLAHPAGST